ncbi:pentatricopeptide repeat-containing protein At1g05600 [Diospyros lotus]|uniref:pentatricopeptide repeat-containing protein At1g05600 n=1 Tax=Diospyros lotus TaxID=55363 RepID=UPI0022509F92|nr:pentatricopeptide repeat-containing protein At1g05600 [Diospyros lotus]XP_052197507.1 pentatricopeptide repeat-containing protein At1g05600 [Diospyros lotus]
MNIIWPRLLAPTQLIQLIRRQKNPLISLRIFNEAKTKFPEYHHNGPAYATMISILGSSGHIAEMKEVIGLMKNDSCECRDLVFAGAIKTYAKAGLLDEAISLFRSLPQFNCVNWTVSFNTLLQIMLKESDLETACHLFLENSHGWEVKSQIRSLNLLIEALCRRNRSDLALQVFQEMNDICCYPDRETYQILMRGLCEDGRLNEAIHLLYSMFWRISQKGSGEDVTVYRILLDALCDHEQGQEAMKILDKVLRKGLKARKRCRIKLDLNGCYGDLEIQDAKVLIHEALIKGLVPNSASYSAMAVDLYSEGKMAEANKVISEMNEKGFRPSIVIYKAKLAALCREGKVDEAIEVIERSMGESNCVPTVELYNMVMKGLCDERKSGLAVKYLEKMARQVGCVPNKATYTILVNGLCHEGRFVEASRILEEMLVKSYWPSLATYDVLIHGLCNMGRPYEAVAWLEEMVSQGQMPKGCVWDSLVTSICSGGVVSDFFSAMLEQLRGP